jgi:hypothetical protein
MGETTEILHRRVRHWRTTAAGVASIVAPVIALFCPPDLAIKVLAAASALAGSGLIAAADARPKQETKP